MVRNTINFDVESDASKVVSEIKFSVLRDELSYDHIRFISRTDGVDLLKRIYVMRLEIGNLENGLRKSMESIFLRTALAMAENDLIEKFKFRPKSFGLFYKHNFPRRWGIATYNPR